MTFEGFSDAFFGSDDNRLSVNDCCIFLNVNLVYWATKRQTQITRSAAAAELLALDFTYCKMKEIRTLIEGFGGSASKLIMSINTTSQFSYCFTRTITIKEDEIKISYKLLKEEVKKGQFTTTARCANCANSVDSVDSVDSAVY